MVVLLLVLVLVGRRLRPEWVVRLRPVELVQLVGHLDRWLVPHPALALYNISHIRPDGMEYLYSVTAISH